MKPDLPIEQRAVQSTLFGMKWLLTEWGFDRKAMWVDTDAGTLKLGEDLIMMAWSHSNGLEKKFEDGWADCLQSTELDKIVEVASAKLRQNREPTKGLGKGTNKGTQGNNGYAGSASHAGW